jgi:ketosteroid isomerase-like protein
MVSPESIAAVIARYYAAVRTKDVEAWVALFAADGSAVDPIGTPTHQGHDGLRAFLSGVLQGFESLGLAENAVFIVPDGAAVKWTGVGRGKNGRDVAFEGIDVFVFDGEARIKSIAGYWDAPPVLAAIEAPWGPITSS